MNPNIAILTLANGNTIAVNGALHIGDPKPLDILIDQVRRINDMLSEQLSFDVELDEFLLREPHDLTWTPPTHTSPLPRSASQAKRRRKARRSGR